MPVLSAPLRLSDNLYLAYSEYPHVDSGNVYLLTGTHPTLIDCGSQRAGPQLVRNLAQAGLGPGDIHQVIATHGDCDHTQGYHDLRLLQPDLRLSMHPQDWPLVIEGDPYRNSNYVYRRPFMPFAADHCLPLDDGDAVPAGDTVLTVHHTPGHTDGSICLLGEIDGRRVLFAGDTIGGSMKSLTGADLRVWAEAAAAWTLSLDYLRTLSFDWVLNGHEPAEGLPLSRAYVDRLLASFGMMMNPWFLLGEDDVLAGAMPGAR